MIIPKSSPRPARRTSLTTSSRKRFTFKKPSWNVKDQEPVADACKEEEATSSSISTAEKKDLEPVDAFLEKAFEADSDETEQPARKKRNILEEGLEPVMHVTEERLNEEELERKNLESVAKKVNALERLEKLERPFQRVLDVSADVPTRTPGLETFSDVSRKLSPVSPHFSANALDTQLSGRSATTTNAAQDREAQKSILSALDKKITVFKGQQDAKIVQGFLERYERYCLHARLSDETIISLLVVYLDTEVQNVWWDYFHIHDLPVLRQTAIDQDVPCWPLVRKAFRMEFTPKDFVLEATRRLHSLNTNGGLANYVRQFKITSASIPDIGELELLRTIESALSPVHRDYLDSHKDYVRTSRTALHLLQDYAERHEKIKTNPVQRHERHHGNQTSRPPMTTDRKVQCYKCNRFGHVSSECRSQSRPRVNNIRDRAAAKPSHANATTVWTEASLRDFKAYPQATDEMKAFIRAKNGCTWCRKLHVEPGHLAETCRNKYLEERGKRGQDFHPRR